MAIWDSISKAVGNTANAIGNKTKEVVETTRVNADISALQDKKSKLLVQLGEMYYAKAETSGMDSLCECIAKLDVEIAKLEKKIDTIRNVHRCAVCGEAVELGARFCPHCGAKMETEAPAEPAEAEFTPDSDGPVTDPELEDLLNKLGTGLGNDEDAEEDEEEDGEKEDGGFFSNVIPDNVAEDLRKGLDDLRKGVEDIGEDIRKNVGSFVDSLKPKSAEEQKEELLSAMREREGTQTQSFTDINAFRKAAEEAAAEAQETAAEVKEIIEGTFEEKTEE